MGFIPPPRQLSTEEFNARAERLRADGKQVTMETVDPVFWRWSHGSSFKSACVILGASLTLVIALCFW